MPPIPMKVVFSLLSAIIVITVAVATVLFGHGRVAEAGETLKEKSQGAREAFQRVSNLITLASSPQAAAKCTLSGGIYKYEVSVENLAVLFKDKPGIKTTLVPVLKYKEKKGLDAKRTKETLESNVPYTFAAGKKLNYVVFSREPPPIFQKAPGAYYGVFIKRQRIVMNNIEIYVRDIRAKEGPKSLSDFLRSSEGTCTVFLNVQCRDDAMSLQVSECAENSEACLASADLCNVGVSVTLDKFDKSGRCSDRKPYLLIQTVDKEAPKWNYNEKILMGFCRKASIAEECSFTEGDNNFLGVAEIEILENNYNSAGCITEENV